MGFAFVLLGFVEHPDPVRTALVGRAVLGPLGALLARALMGPAPPGPVWAGPLWAPPGPLQHEPL